MTGPRSRAIWWARSRSIVDSKEVPRIREASYRTFAESGAAPCARQARAADVARVVTPGVSDRRPPGCKDVLRASGSQPSPSGRRHPTEAAGLDEIVTRWLCRWAELRDGHRRRGHVVRVTQDRPAANGCVELSARASGRIGESDPDYEDDVELFMVHCSETADYAIPIDEATRHGTLRSTHRTAGQGRSVGAGLRVAGVAQLVEHALVISGPGVRVPSPALGSA